MATKSQPSTSFQEPNKNPANPIEIVQVVLELLIILIQSIYFNLESIYRIFAPLPEKSVRGEVVLVTGAGHGIGKQIAILYANLGATVVCWDINAKNNEETVKYIQKKGFPKAHSYVCDVSNREMVFEMVDKVKKDVGDVTIIINNAGIMPTHSLLDHTKEEIEKSFGINVLAHFWIIQAILPSMLKNNHGHIVSISSIAGLFGQQNLVPYCATKFAVRGYMESLYHEINVKPNRQVHLTCIYPSMVDTGLCKKPRGRFQSTLKMLTPEEVATKIIDAQRRNIREAAIPSYYFYMNNLFRLGSAKFSHRFKKFLNIYLESDL